MEESKNYEKVEDALLTRSFVPSNAAILEITFSEQEILICNSAGDLMAKRIFEPGSPMEKVIELLRQLVASTAYTKP